MRKFLRRYLPSHESIIRNRWTGYLSAYLTHHNLWHLNRRSVPGGVAVGLFTGLIPGPVQIIGSVFLSILFRINLPVAAITTIYTNPFTIVPLYALAYQLGMLVTGLNHQPNPDELKLSEIAPPEMTWDNWHIAMFEWMVSLGKPLAVGLPLLAISLAIVGYFVVRIMWRVFVILAWRKRMARHKGDK